MTATTLLLIILIISLAAIAAGVVFAQRRLAARGIARALGYEAASLRWQAAAMAVEITRRHRAGEPFDTDFFRTWRLSEPQIFPAVGGDLGLMSPGAIDRLGYFHAQLAAARERLALAAADGGFRPSPYRILSCLVRAYNHVEPWVTPYLDIVTRDTPDMADANRVIDEWEKPGGEPIAAAYVWADSGMWWIGDTEEDPA